MNTPFALRTPQQLSQQLKSLRRLRGLTQAQVAKRLGINQSRYASIENRPGSVSMNRLLKVLAALRAELLLQPKSAPGQAAAPAGEGW